MNKYLSILAFACITGGSISTSAKELYGPYTAEVIRVKDGDTIFIDIAIWPGLTQRISLRLDGVNTPEKRGKGVTDCEKAAAKDATAFTASFLSRSRIINVDGIRRGKYAGRVLGRISVNGKYLGQALLEHGHARAYRGGKRIPWC